MEQSFFSVTMEQLAARAKRVSETSSVQRARSFVKGKRKQRDDDRGAEKKKRYNPHRDRMVEWRLADVLGSVARSMPEKYGVTVEITRVLKKDPKGRATWAFARHYRDLAEAKRYIYEHGRDPPSDYYEDICIGGNLTSISAHMFLHISDAEYKPAPKKGQRAMKPALILKRGNRCRHEPKPMTQQVFRDLFDCSETEMHKVWIYYGLNTVTDRVLPRHVLAQLRRALFREIKATLKPVVIDPEIVRKHNIIPIEWHYDGDASTIPDLPLTERVAARIRMVAALQTLMPGQNNSEFSRKRENQHGQWNDRGNIKVASKERDANHGYRDQSSAKLLTIKDYLLYPEMCVIGGFFNAQHKTKKRGLTNENASKLVNMYQQHVMPFMSDYDRKRLSDIEHIENDLARGGRNSSVEKMAAVEYMGSYTVIALSHIIVEHPDWLAYKPKIVAELDLPKSMNWSELTGIQIAQTVVTLGLEPLRFDKIEAIAVYHKQLRDQLKGFFKHTCIPQRLVERNSQTNMVTSQTRAAIDYLVEIGVVVRDEDPEVTELARAFYSEGSWPQRIAPNATGFNTLPHADDDTRIYIEKPLNLEKRLVKAIIEVLERSAERPVEFHKFNEYCEEHYGGVDKLPYVPDETQLHTINAIRNPRRVCDSMQIVTGGPGMGKSDIIAWLCTLVKDRKRVLVGTMAAQAAFNVKKRLGRSPFDIAEEVVCTTLDGLLHARGHNNPKVFAARNDCELLILDEASQLPLSTLSDVLSRLPQCRQVVFVGDPNQLGAISYGEPLNDLMRIFPVHKLKKFYRADPSAITLNTNLQIIIEDPRHAMDRIQYAFAANPRRLRQAHRVARNPEAQAMPKEEIDKLVAIAKEPLVFVPRPPEEYERGSTKAHSAAEIWNFYVDAFGATQDQIQFITYYRETALTVGAEIQAIVSRFHDSAKALQQKALVYALRKLNNEFLDYDSFREEQEGGTFDPRFLKSYLPLYDENRIVFTKNHNRETQWSCVVRNGQEKKVQYIVDVCKMKHETPTGKNYWQFVVPTHHDIENNIGSNWTRLESTFAPPQQQEFKRFLYFTDGSKICFDDFEEGEIMLAYCRTTSTFQGGECDYVCWVIDPRSVQQRMCNKPAAVVNMSRARRHLTIIGHPKTPSNVQNAQPELEAIIRREQRDVYNYFSFRLKAAIDNEHSRLMRLKREARKRAREREEEDERQDEKRFKPEDGRTSLMPDDDEALLAAMCAAADQAEAKYNAAHAYEPTKASSPPSATAEAPMSEEEKQRLAAETMAGIDMDAFFAMD